MNITNQLKTNNDIFKKSFEYLILRLCQEYCKENCIKAFNDATQIERFNRINNISLPKVWVYPFFISFSNRYLPSLFELFGNFHYSNDFGYISKRAIFEDVEYFSEYFSIDYDSVFLKITNSTIESQIRKIKSSSVTIENELYSFDSLLVNKESGGVSLLFESIDSGIITMMKATLGQFINLSEYKLRDNSEKYRMKMGLADTEEITIITPDIDSKRKEYI